SDNLDFHPTDVKEDADGSLLVIDTGGWYKLCCPTSQLHKPDVLGAIYRVRKTGAPKIDDPRGRKIDWAKLKPEEFAKLLGDERPAVRRRAVAAVGQKWAADGFDAQLALKLLLSNSAETRRGAVWAAARVDSEPARALLRLAPTTEGVDEATRQAALHAVS